jgi:DNA adenine methylase
MKTNDMTLSPIIKWAGGKEKELSFIIPSIPQNFENYYEPFVGGGSVFTAISAKKYFINDKSKELINLYNSIASNNLSFFSWMKHIITSWNNMLLFVSQHEDLCKHYLSYRNNSMTETGMRTAIVSFLLDHTAELNNVPTPSFSWHRDIFNNELKKNVTRKILRMRKIEQEKGCMPDNDIYDNIETAFMSSLYMYFRCIYNDTALMQTDDSLATAIFTFIRNYAYSGMFRYNDDGDFNVPYGGIAYNHKQLTKKLDYYQSVGLLNHFSNTAVFNLDFEEFLHRNSPSKDDFIFLDPPYDSEFSTYAQNKFTQDDQRRLANYLINECEARWMLVIKYTPFIYSIYNNKKLSIKTFSKNYLVSFMNRNNKKAEHLIITNY